MKFLLLSKEYMNKLFNEIDNIKVVLLMVKERK